MTKKKPAAKKPASRKPAKAAAKAKRPAAPKPQPVKAGTGSEAARLRKLAFVDAYLKNGSNATQAAISAGYSAHTAKQTGSRLLTDAVVRRTLAEVGERLVNRYRLSVEMVERSIAQEITFDPAKLYREDGSIKDVTELDEDTRMALAGVEFETVGSDKDGYSHVRKIKWASKAPAREQAMKYLGMFEKDNTQKNPLGGLAPEAMEAARTQLASLIAAQKSGAKSIGRGA